MLTLMPTSAAIASAVADFLASAPPDTVILVSQYPDRGNPIFTRQHVDTSRTLPDLEAYWDSDYTSFRLADDGQQLEIWYAPPERKLRYYVYEHVPPDCVS